MLGVPYILVSVPSCRRVQSWEFLIRIQGLTVMFFKTAIAETQSYLIVKIYYLGRVLEKTLEPTSKERLVQNSTKTKNHPLSRLSFKSCFPLDLLTLLFDVLN